jgi:ABC-type transporter MlaC component
MGILLAVAAIPALAGEPTDQLKESINRVLAILNDSGLKEAERRKLIREAANDRFDWAAMARSAMGVYGRVEVNIITHKGTGIPITYWVTEKKGQWLIYDVSIEGVSLVENYRSQITTIMTNSSYEELVEKLKAKFVTEERPGNP